MISSNTFYREQMYNPNILTYHPPSARLHYCKCHLDPPKQDCTECYTFLYNLWHLQSHTEGMIPMLIDICTDLSGIVFNSVSHSIWLFSRIKNTITTSLHICSLHINICSGTCCICYYIICNKIHQMFYHLAKIYYMGAYSQSESLILIQSRTNQDSENLLYSVKLSQFSHIVSLLNMVDRQSNFT